MLCSRYILAACFSLFLFLWLRDSVSRETHIHSWCLEAHIITCFINMASEFSHSLFSRGVEFLVIFPLLSRLLLHPCSLLSSSFIPPVTRHVSSHFTPWKYHSSKFHFIFTDWRTTKWLKMRWKETSLYRLMESGKTVPFSDMLFHVPSSSWLPLVFSPGQQLNL